MSIADHFIMELEQESGTTRNVLTRVPADKLAWKPHTKSMHLGQLAHHIATLPGGIAQMATLDGMDMSQFTSPPPPDTLDAILAEFDAGVAQAKQVIGSFDDAKMAGMWTLSMGDKVLLTVPRAGLLRTILFNHLYHHRGQLTVYLRELDVPVPSVYGPSADENPFA